MSRSSDNRGLNRRELLFGTAAAGIGAAVTLGVESALATATTVAQQPIISGGEAVPFYGEHQAGIETTPQAHAAFIALDMKPEMDRDALKRLLRILSADAESLTQGTPALADTEPELATEPARLTVTFGFGPGFVASAGGLSPVWLRPLPAFAVDRLEDRWSGGDLLLHVASDDPVTVAHATRMLLKDSRSFATVRWTQTGFRRALGTEQPGTTMRNLFGQVDGTVNPTPGTPDFETLVWGASSNPAWLRGGTSMVLRRVVMDLDSWDRVDRVGREEVMGRRLANGAPLTGNAENDEPDFAATTPLGFPVIADSAHIRRARSENTDQRIYRRGYNYDDAPMEGGTSNSGLLFVSYQANVDEQFVPLQRRLDTLDMLNEWTTPVGSAVFAIPPGCSPGGYIGETLFA